MNKVLHYAKKNKWSYLFLLPWMVLFIIFFIYPAISGIIISLYKFDFVTNKFIGIENYVSLFRDKQFVNSILNSFKFVIVLVPSTILFSLFVSIVITKMKRWKQSFFKVIFFAPAITSTVAVATVWKWMYNPAYGLSLYITDMLGLKSINWLGNPINVIIAISIIVFTYQVGQPIILFSAAIMNIPETYYEAAYLDGAGRFQVHKNITIPLIKPTSMYVLLISTIACFQIFEFILLITAGGPNYSSNTIMYNMYLNAFSYSQFGLATAMGVILTGIILVIAAIQFRIFKTDIEY